MKRKEWLKFFKRKADKGLNAKYIAYDIKGAALGEVVYKHGKVISSREYIGVEDSMEEEILKKNCFSSDREYLDGYFVICDLYLKKRCLIKQTWEMYEAKRKIPQEERNALKKELDFLNIVIRDKEESFWETVEISKQAGKLFAVEEFISHFQMDQLEKRIFLFLLFLTLGYADETSCSGQELVCLFDQSNSPVSKINGLGGFVLKGNTLLKNNIIMSLAPLRGESLYSLSDRVIPFLAKMFNGQKINYAELGEGVSDNLCETVGYIKESKYSLDQVVLKDELKEKVLFLLDSLKKDAENKTEGVRFLFFGPPGTGKSMLAEAIAGYLGKKLLMAEFPKITSRWYGDTDKNISRLFKGAERAGLVLCIDEADTILYNRNYAVQEHDIRFVNEMLQELDRFKGVAILTTNMDILLDPALERRLSLKVKFDLPDEKLRQQIWQSHIPSEIKIGPDVDFAGLANKYEFSGGYIKNAVTHAMRRLANEGRNTLVMDDLLFGARLEQEGAFVKESKPKIGFFANS